MLHHSFVDPVSFLHSWISTQELSPSPSRRDRQRSTCRRRPVLACISQVTFVFVVKSLLPSSVSSVFHAWTSQCWCQFHLPRITHRICPSCRTPELRRASFFQRICIFLIDVLCFDSRTAERFDFPCDRATTFTTVPRLQRTPVRHQCMGVFDPTFQLVDNSNIHARCTLSSTPKFSL